MGHKKMKKETNCCEQQTTSQTIHLKNLQAEFYKNEWFFLTFYKLKVE